MDDIINESIIKLVNQSTTPLQIYIDTVKPYILSKRLNPAQQEQLLGYLKYLMVEKSISVSPSYLKQVFRVLRDFGASMKRSFREVDLDDFKIYYSSIVDNNNVSNKTLEQYEHHLKRFCGWLFEKEGRLGEWKELEFKVKMIFNKDKIDENMRLDYRQAVANKKQRSVLRYLKSPLLSEEQREVLNNYHRYVVSGVKRKVSVHCIHKMMMVLHQFASYIKKPFNKVNKQDFTNYLYHLSNEKKLSPVTLDSYKHIIKQFYKFLHYGALDPKQEYPEIVKDIELDKIQIKKSANEMLSRTEISKIIQHCTNIRDKLMVSLHYEAITRPEELFTIRIGDIRSDDYGFEIDIKRIKQKNRENNKLPFRVIESEPYLREWINLHPLKSDKDTYLFISLKQTGKYVLYSGLDKLVKRASKAAGITKRVYPYIFRHSRITHLKQEGWSDDQIKQITGHSDKSDILSNYSHLTPSDVNNKRLREAGKLKHEENDKVTKDLEALQPKKCPRCEKINPHDAGYCNCGMALDLRTVMRDQKRAEEETNKTFQLIMEIAKNPQLMKQFEEFRKNYKQ